MRIQAARFEAVPLAKVAEQYDLGALTNDGLYLEDVFGDVPTHVYIHRGDLAIAGPLELAGEGDRLTLFVVDGDLEVSGPILFRSAWQVPLVVTGSVRATALLLEGRATLIILGALLLEGPLVTAFDDGGLYIHGAQFAAEAWIDHVGRGTVESLARPEMPLYFDAAGDAAAPQSRHEFHDPLVLAAELADEADDEGGEDERLIYMRAHVRPADARTVVPSALWSGDLLDPKRIYDELLAGRRILA
jgi:hypothetical protein